MVAKRETLVAAEPNRIKSNGGVISSERLSTHNGKQPTFLVKEQIFGNPKRGVEAKEQNGDNQRHQDVEADVGGDERNDCDQTQNEDDGSIVEGLVEDYERAVAGEVEVVPGHEEEEEDDHGERVPEEAQEHDEKRHAGVVESEVVQVSAKPNHGLVVGVGAGEGR